MKGDVISDHFMTLWLQKDSLDTVGFRIFRTFRVRDLGVLISILVDQSDIRSPKCTEGGRGTGLGLFPKSDHFFSASLTQFDSNTEI